ncbi:MULTISPECIES: nuclear transport factor 2 family protein [unclassified Microbacterium]|uniref:YybH family protein n=1 Tax=unclassified Microbacterium TaxID=2609290 RepID=UPI00214AD0ED|nr:MULTISPECIES: nuclear transport factor 2 family protein [unclassified Microbacterium]MCR2810625.1 nuclear transport factor 2 family protein [Microbacterium sp. zg.B185]WIM18162.1 nuclear transport factor 2 family protein [Microbacterium sp. zg-B185]
MTEEQDREAILKVHRDWWVANHKWDIPLMRECFPSGYSFLNFNLSGDPYFGREELTAFWEYFKDTPRELPAVMHIWRLTVKGDMAWLVCEGNFETATAPNQFIRTTEIYQRDDGDGNPEWKIWHFHCSPTSPLDRPRQPFGDSYNSRGGLGYLPYGESFSVTADQ